MSQDDKQSRGDRDPGGARQVGAYSGAAALYQLGEMLRSQGDLSGALHNYQAGAAMAESLLRGAPAQAQWQFELAICHGGSGTVLALQGDIEGALRSFHLKHEILAKLAETYPSDEDYQRELSESIEKIGDVHAARDDLAGAIKHYRQALAISERLAASETDNLSRLQDLGISYEKLAAALQSQGFHEGAMEAFKRKQEISLALVKCAPSNPNFQRDLAVSFHRLGDAWFAQANPVEAVAAYQASEQILQSLVAACPGQALFQHDLASVLLRISNILLWREDHIGVLKTSREALPVLDRLASSDETNSTYKHDLAICLYQLATAAGTLATEDDAAEYYDRCYTTLARMREEGLALPTDLSSMYNQVEAVLNCRRRLAGQVAKVLYLESVSAGSSGTLPCPFGLTLPEAKNLIDRVLEAHRLECDRVGSDMPLLLGLPDGWVQGIESHCTSRMYWGMKPELVSIIPQPEVPLLGSDGQLLIDQDSFSLKLHLAGGGSCLGQMIESGKLSELWKSGIRWLLLGQVLNTRIHMGTTIYQRLDKCESDGLFEIADRSLLPDSVLVILQSDGALVCVDDRRLRSDQWSHLRDSPLVGTGSFWVRCDRLAAAFGITISDLEADWDRDFWKGKVSAELRDNHSVLDARDGTSAIVVPLWEALSRLRMDPIKVGSDLATGSREGGVGLRQE
jgi:tetratricopeptide (TPR) repeat protein